MNETHFEGSQGARPSMLSKFASRGFMLAATLFMAPVAAHAAGVPLDRETLRTAMLIGEVAPNPEWLFPGGFALTLGLNIVSIELSHSIWPIDHHHGE